MFRVNRSRWRPVSEIGSFLECFKANWNRFLSLCIFKSHLDFFFFSLDFPLMASVICKKLPVAFFRSSPFLFTRSTSSWFSLSWSMFLFIKAFVSLMALFWPWYGFELATPPPNKGYCIWDLSTDLAFEGADFPKCWNAALLLVGFPALSFSYFSMLSVIVCTRLKRPFLGYLTSACMA